jgi:Ca-activated chloride channel family protein
MLQQFDTLVPSLDYNRPMKRGSLISRAIVVAMTIGSVAAAAAQEPAAQPPTATFRSAVDMVRVTAVVRDGKGRFVRDLKARDFEVLDRGQSRPIAEFRPDLSGVSVALLFDVSGSMEGQMPSAREAAKHVLSWLDATLDEAAVFTFDTHLDEVAPFTTGLRTLPEAMGSVVPFGATSLHDAVAETAKRLGTREGRRRAVIVLTDGNDNTSRLSPSEVSAIASEIDVPVYLFGIVPSIDNPTSDMATNSIAQAALGGSLSDLASWTGGHTFVASTPGQRSAAARQIIDELRHQYLIAFEASGNPGWHPLVVRAKQKDLVVRTRSGYIAGQSRPSF